jgi:hypothetical protein
MQQVEFALSAMIAKLSCHSAMFTAFLRMLATPEVHELVQPQIIFNSIFSFITGTICFSSL